MPHNRYSRLIPMLTLCLGLCVCHTLFGQETSGPLDEGAIDEFVSVRHDEEQAAQQLFAGVDVLSDAYVARLQRGMEALRSGGHEDSPLYNRLLVADIERRVAGGQFDNDLKERIEEAARRIRADPFRHPWSMNQLLSLWSIVPPGIEQEGQKGGAAVSPRLDITRTVYESLGVPVSGSPIEMMNYATLEMNEGGDLAKARLLLDAARPELERHPDTDEQARWLWISTRVDTLAGRYDQAEQQLQQLLELCEKGGGKYCSHVKQASAFLRQDIDDRKRRTRPQQPFGTAHSRVGR